MLGRNKNAAQLTLLSKFCSITRHDSYSVMTVVDYFLNPFMTLYKQPVELLRFPLNLYFRRKDRNGVSAGI